MTRWTCFLLALVAVGALAGCPATSGVGTHADGGGGGVTDGGSTGADGGGSTDGGTTDGGPVADGGSPDGGGATDAGTPGQPMHPGASLTGGSGAAASTHYRLHLNVGAPQPAGRTRGGTHQITTGASPGR